MQILIIVDDEQLPCARVYAEMLRAAWPRAAIYVVRRLSTTVEDLLRIVNARAVGPVTVVAGDSRFESLVPVDEIRAALLG